MGKSEATRRMRPALLRFVALCVLGHCLAVPEKGDAVQLIDIHELPPQSTDSELLGESSETNAVVELAKEFTGEQNMLRSLDKDISEGDMNSMKAAAKADHALNDHRAKDKARAKAKAAEARHDLKAAASAAKKADRASKSYADLPPLLSSDSSDAYN